MKIVTPTRAIVNQLMNGDASCLTQDVIFNINQMTIALLNKEPLNEVEQAVVEDIIHISNIIYNNTDRSILVLEDGVYDLLLEKHKRYNPNYQVGAEPIVLGKFNVSDGTSGNIDGFEDSYDRLFIYHPIPNTEGMMFGKDIVEQQDHYGESIIDGSGIQTVSKRIRNTNHMYPELVGTLDKNKFVTIAEAQQAGVADKPNVKIFERDFLQEHINKGIIDPNNITLILELKYDGVSVEAEVTDRILSARTRGDTSIDQATDLTPILKGYRFTRASGLNIKPFGMKFEAMVSTQNLINLNAECGKRYVNSRNAVQGILGNSDAAMFAKYITLVPLQSTLINDKGEPLGRDEELMWLNKYYSTGEFCRWAYASGNYMQVLYQVYRFVKEAENLRQYSPFMYDGVVVSYLDKNIRNYLGRKNSVNQYSVAIKFNAIRKNTRCRGIGYTVGARGDITPMIYYDPVEFFGTIHTKSSGHSYARFKELNLRPNDIIEVEYVNDVMPYVNKVYVPENDFNPMRPFEFIRTCPECGSPLYESESGKNVTCNNFMCKGRVVARLTNMFEKLRISGFSESTVKQLGLTSFYDFMTLTEERTSVLGPKSSKDLLSIIDRLYEANVPDFELLGSLGFSGISNGKWKKILTAVPLHKIIQGSDIALSTLLRNSSRGIGEKTANTIIEERQYFLRDLTYIYNMPNVIKTAGGSDVNIKPGKTIRFSGVRDRELEMRLSANGHDCSDGAVTKTTDILIIPYVGFSSSKTTKAEQYNTSGSHITIVPLADFKMSEAAYLNC
jgi:DNA ligase (NAD+)